MGWFFGATAGLIIGGPLGAVVGGVLQHMATKPGQNDRIGQKDEAIFISNLVAIITNVAMADGHVSQAEIATINQFFQNTLGYTGQELEFIDRLIEETITQKPPLEHICSEFLGYSNVETRMLLLNILYQVAYTDHEITSQEQTQIDRTAILLHIPAQVNAKIKNTYYRSNSRSRSQSYSSSQSTTQKSSSISAYSILGVERSATDDEIKKAYRTLAMQYHPDKVSHLGKELVDFAQTKFTKINSAYNEIKQARGL